MAVETRELESRLMERIAEAEAGARESERKHLDELARLSLELEQTQAREGASVRRLSEFGARVGELEATLERLRQDTEVDHQRFQSSLKSLQDQENDEQKAWECELNAARQQHTLDLAAHREESDRFRRQVEELRHERDMAIEKAEESGRETRALAQQKYDLEFVNEQSRHSLAELSRNPDPVPHDATDQVPQAAPIGDDPQMTIVSDTLGTAIDPCLSPDSISPPDCARSRALTWTLCLASIER